MYVQHNRNALTRTQMAMLRGVRPRVEAIQKADQACNRFIIDRTGEQPVYFDREAKCEVPESTFRHVCEERDELVADLADLLDKLYADRVTARELRDIDIPKGIFTRARMVVIKGETL